MPGKMSQRTDSQPEFTGLGYGENKAVNDQMSSAPMPSGPSTPSAQGGGPAAPMGREGVFGPTSRPQEPMTAGVDWGPGAAAPPKVMQDDPYLLARALLQADPGNEQLARIVARLARG